MPVRGRRIYAGVECRGNIYVDVVELHHGGPTPSERAVLSLVEAMNESLSQSSSKVMCLVVMAEGAHACLPWPDRRDMTRIHMARESRVLKGGGKQRDGVLYNRTSD